MNNSTLLLVALSLFLIASVSSRTLISSVSATTELTPDDFYSVVGKEKHVFAKFYAPWCGHCRQLAPTWDKLAERYAGRDDVVIVKINADKYRDLASKFSVRGYPTLYFFEPNSLKTTEYYGGRGLNELTRWVDERLAMPAATAEEGGAQQQQEDEKIAGATSGGGGGGGGGQFESHSMMLGFSDVVALVLAMMLFIYQEITWNFDIEGYTNRQYYGASRRHLFAQIVSLPHLFGFFAILNQAAILKVLYFLYLGVVLALQVYWWWHPYFFLTARGGGGGGGGAGSSSASGGILGGGVVGAAGAGTEVGFDWDWITEYRKHYAMNLRLLAPTHRGNRGGYPLIVPDADHTILGAALLLCTVATFFSL